MATAETPRQVIPLLEQGDHLTREEFERRYDAMPRLKKAELIEGVVHTPSPVRLDQHGSQHADFIGWLVHYRAHTPHIRVGDNISVRLDMDNEPQPDAAMLIETRCGGQSQVSPDSFIEGAPELVGEVAASSVNIDFHSKMQVYLRNRVREYIVWRVLDRAIDWFVLRQSQYERLPLTPAGLYQRKVFPGLWFHPAQMIEFNLAGVLQVLQQGLASPEHAAFVAKLQQKASQPPAHSAGPA